MKQKVAHIIQPLDFGMTELLTLGILATSWDCVSPQVRMQSYQMTDLAFLECNWKIKICNWRVSHEWYATNLTNQG